MLKQAFAAIAASARVAAARGLVIVSACAVLALSVGCASSESAPDSDLQREGQALFGGGARSNSSGSAEATGSMSDGGRVESAGAEAWSIVLATFRGEGQIDAARVALRRMQTEGRLPEAFIERRGPATSIAYGRYSGPDDAAAQRDLKRIQGMEFRGLKPYWIAYLAPPYADAKIGSRPEYNLLSAKAMFGSRALYTLQVAAYGRDELAHPTEADLAEARKKAEEAAAILRQEGEPAFYYHGPRLSMVTVGVFDDADVNPPSARLREAMQRHPYNLYNGRGVRVRARGSDQWHMQKSKLVRIPEK